MANSRKFTIEANDSNIDSIPASKNDDKPAAAESVDDQNAQIEAIKAAVTSIIRDELRNWQPPSMDAAPASSSQTSIETSNEVLKELAEIQAHIATTKAEISALKPEDGDETQFSSAKQELQEIVDATAKATNDILSESERIVEISGILVERLPDDQIEAIGEEIVSLDNASTQIMLACGFQDLTGQRITKVVNTMIFVEERIDALLNLWKIKEGTGSADLVSVRKDDDRPDKDLLNGPQNEGEGISQNDIDAMFG